jgi:hypothetical protein
MNYLVSELNEVANVNLWSSLSIMHGKVVQS